MGFTTLRTLQLHNNFEGHASSSVCSNYLRLMTSLGKHLQNKIPHIFHHIFSTQQACCHIHAYIYVHVTAIGSLLSLSAWCLYRAWSQASDPGGRSLSARTRHHVQESSQVIL